MVVFGNSNETPLFAVEALCRWWRCEAPHRDPDAYFSSCVSASAAIKWSLVQLTLHPREQRGGLLVFENRIATGQTHVLALRVCPDPVCRCEHLFVIGAAEPSEPKSLDDVPTWRVDLDLGERRVQVPKEHQGDTASVSVAKAFQTEITADQWTELRRFYKAWKEEQTEKADLDQLETHFPPEAADGSMVGYYEILPHARPIEVRVEEQAWQFDDQYCVQRDCGCQSAGLTFIPVMGEGSQRNAGPRLRLGFRYSYNDGQADHVTAGADAPSVSEMLGALRNPIRRDPPSLCVLPV